MPSLSDAVAFQIVLIGAQMCVLQQSIVQWSARYCRVMLRIKTECRLIITLVCVDAHLRACNSLIYVSDEYGEWY